ncbi:MAG: isoprenylcysteine carboxylmethyltransferase family protein [Alphaproteobacteria bacterium]
MNPHIVVVGFFVLQRLAELVYSRRNLQRLVAQGAMVIDEPVYAWIIAVHAGWLAAMAFLIPAEAFIHFRFLFLYLALLAVRIWVMASLGRYWCTRIVTLPGAPLVKRGPYRFIRHPNYVVVVAEIAVAPLIMGAWKIAVVFSILNAVALWFRIRTEDKVLEARGA